MKMADDGQNLWPLRLARSGGESRSTSTETLASMEDYPNYSVYNKLKGYHGESNVVNQIKEGPQIPDKDMIDEYESSWAKNYFQSIGAVLESSSSSESNSEPDEAEASVDVNNDIAIPVDDGHEEFDEIESLEEDRPTSRMSDLRSEFSAKTDDLCLRLDDDEDLESDDSDSESYHGEESIPERPALLELDPKKVTAAEQALWAQRYCSTNCSGIVRVTSDDYVRKEFFVDVSFFECIHGECNFRTAKLEDIQSHIVNTPASQHVQTEIENETPSSSQELSQPEPDVFADEASQPDDVLQEQPEPSVGDNSAPPLEENESVVVDNNNDANVEIEIDDGIAIKSLWPEDYNGPGQMYFCDDCSYQDMSRSIVIEHHKSAHQQS